MGPTTIISTDSVNNLIGTKLKEVISVNHWLLPNSIPYKQKEILQLLQRNGILSGTVIILVKYGKREPAHFPKICIGDFLITLVFYKKTEQISNWIYGLKKFEEVKPMKALSLSMMKPLYMNWGEKIYSSLRKSRYAKKDVRKHFPDTTTSHELGRKLSKGCALAIYVGHGRSRGWSGYRGFRLHHLDKFKQIAPIGSLISLSCSSLKKDKKDSLPMGLQLIMEGRSCAFLGTWDAVHIVPLRTITKILLDILSQKSQEPIGQVLQKAHQKIISLNDSHVIENWEKFRLIGNPFQVI